MYGKSSAQALLQLACLSLTLYLANNSRPAQALKLPNSQLTEGNETSSHILKDCSERLNPKFSCIAAPMSPEKIREKLYSIPIAFWVEGGLLHIAVQRLPRPMLLEGTFTAALRPIEGTDFQELTIRLAANSQDTVLIKLVHNGAVLVEHPQKTKSSGKVNKRSGITYFNLLGKNYSRRISVYKPINTKVDGSLPVIYMTDGQDVEVYAPILDTLIEEGVVRPAMIVGVWSIPSERERDYVYTNKASFKQFREFFVNVVLPYARNNLGASAAPSEQFLSGSSNGADWALAMHADDPVAFPNVLAMSPAIKASATRLPVTDANARIYLASGTLDTHVHDVVAEIRTRANHAGAEVCTQEANVGHSPDFWRRAFPEGIAWLLASREPQKSVCLGDHTAGTRAFP